MGYWTIVLFAVFTTAYAQITLDDCPQTVPRDNFLRAWGSSCYYFVIDHAREYPVAEQECETRHGHLVVIRDAATNAFLVNTLNELNYTGVLFIGMNDIEATGKWMWEDGTEATYTNWEPGQPGILHNFEHCAGINMATNGTWHDYRCEDLLIFSGDHRYICEYPVNLEETTAHDHGNHGQRHTTTATGDVTME